MSFFYDFVKEMKVGDLKSETVLSFIVDKGLKIIGKIKIELLEETKIVFKANKKTVTICGENFHMKTIAKGELLVLGEIKKIELEDWHE